MKTQTLEIEMLQSLIDEPKRQRKPKPEVGIADMTDEQHRAYKAKHQADRRARMAASAKAGELPFDTETTRQALADAALMILKSDGDGADAIREYLAAVFLGKPGVPFTVTARAQSGEMKPKLPHTAKTSK